MDVTLLQNSINSELEKEFLTHNEYCLKVVSALRFEELIPKKENPELPFLVINLDQIKKKPAIFLGLELRNAGYQVFLSNCTDFLDLVSLLDDLNSSIIENRRSLITEVIVTRDTLEKIGNVDNIVLEYELRFIKKRVSLRAEHLMPLM